jgi:citrate synthase
MISSTLLMARASGRPPKMVNVDYRQGMTLLTADQAARRLGVKVETVYAYVSRGALGRQRRAGSRASWFDAGEVEQLARRGRPRRTTRPPAIDVLVESGITAIGEDGHRYRGHLARQLASTATFEQVAELLWTGHLPAFAPWEPVSVSDAELPTPVDRLRHAVVLAAAGDPLAGDLRPEAVVPRARALLATMAAAIPATGDTRAARLDLGDGPLRGTIAGRLWPRLTGAGRPRPALVSALNAALVLLADHELAASTLAARIAASTRADPYAVVLAGLGPLAGPLHGRASRHARRLLDDAADHGVAAALRDALDAHGSYPGFGHPLYPDGDPRARQLLGLVRAAADTEVLDEVVDTVRRRAAVEPNVDLALAALTAAARMRPDAGEVVFAVARAAGWMAHALEEYGSPPLRFRARAVYVG